MGSPLVECSVDMMAGRLVDQMDLCLAVEMVVQRVAWSEK